ncbi:hypothetical protein OAA09_01070 [bacterium]|nr:hypothetical protein [bacterium]
MKTGDLIRVYTISSKFGKQSVGHGIYLGHGMRGQLTTKKFYKLLWKGRIATFDPTCKSWIFEIL